VVSGGRDAQCFRTPLNNLANWELLFVEEKPIQKVEHFSTHIFVFFWDFFLYNL
jgi:hypothetical protein